VARSFNDLSGPSQVLVCAVLSASLGALAWQLLLSPARDDLAERQARAATLLAEVARARATAARLPAVQREIGAVQRSLRKTTAVLPDEKDPQDVLRSLYELASESALDIRRFTPKAVVHRAQYSEWPIELVLAGGYHDLGLFLDRVATMSRLISISDLHIQANVQPTTKSTISASCIATTFVLDNEPGASVPPDLTALAAGPEGQR
jgi:type IV pilus assembly protein PilO